MNDATLNSDVKPIHWADHALKGSAVLWFLAAAIGQWIFVYYVASVYVPKLAIKGFPGLNETNLPSGYIEGDPIGNLAMAAHVVIAIIIIGGGPLQLIPQIRNNFPWFHRTIGKLYMSTAVLTSLAGLYLVWTRGVPGGLVGHIAISLDAVLIISFAAIAVRYAIMRKIDQHRRWAMRLFMVASAVWFFRIGIMFWFLATGGIGIDPETFEGPALTVLYFGQMLIPLTILQIYFWAQDRGGARSKIMTALLLVIATGAMGMGTFAAFMGMWLPHL